MTEVDDWRSILGSFSAEARARGATEQTWEAVRDYARRFVQAAASWNLATAGLVGDQIDLIHDNYWSPDVKAALDRIGDFPTGALHLFTHEQLMGWTNVISGTIFEQTVAQMVNSGVLELPNGADHAVLVGRAQEGWDLALFRGNDLVGQAQVKFSNGGATIIHHLHDHADIPIVITNHEAAEAAHHLGISVIDSHLNYASIHDHVAEQVKDHLGVGTTVHEWVPEFALIALAGRALAMIDDGQPYERARRWFLAEAGKAGISNAGGSVAALLTHTGWIRLPAALTVRGLITRAAVTECAVERIKLCHEWISRFVARPNWRLVPTLQSQ